MVRCHRASGACAAPREEPVEKAVSTLATHQALTAQCESEALEL